MRNLHAAILMFFVLVAHCQNSPDPDRIGPRMVWEPPAFARPDTLPKPTIPKEMIGGLKVEGWPIVLEHTELREAQKHFGGSIGSRGDAGEALGWLCLYKRDPDVSWVLWLESSEIDGPAIGSFRWERLTVDSPMDERCQRLSGRDASVDLPNSLRLGIRESEVVERLGQPSAHIGGVAIYMHEHNLKIDSTPYTLSNEVGIGYRDGKVWVIDVEHTTVS
jgi:hypothetical protein